MPAKKLTRQDRMKRMFKARRAELDLTQAVVAKHYGVAPNTVSVWEGRPDRMSLEWFLDYCKYLKIPKEKVMDIMWE